MARTRRSDLIQVALAASTWGTWSLFLRPAEKAGGIAPAAEAMLMLGTNAVVLAPLAWRERPRAPRSRAAWGRMLASGVVDAGNVLCFFAAMQRTSLAVAVLTHYLAPVLVALLAPRVLREPARRATGAALALSLAGLTLLLEPWRAPSEGLVAGAALGACSAVFYAANVLLAKGLASDFAPSEVVAWHSVPSAVLLAFFVPTGGFAIAPAALGWVLAGSLVAGVAAGLAFMRGLAKVPASQASVLTLLEPLVAVAIGALVWHEPVGMIGLAGGALVLAGAWLVLRGGGPANA